MLDVVYVCRRGENEELRYSLRSLANLPHRNVVIAGYKPEWVRNVIYLPTIQPPADTKYTNSTRNLVTACSDDRLTDDIVLMNDDFYVLRPIDRVEPLHRGPVDDVLAYYRAKGAKGNYVSGMVATKTFLATLGHPNPLSYELHVPMMVNRTGMLSAIKQGMAAGLPVIHKRTLYGNLAGLGGVQIQDVKLSVMKPTGGRTTWNELKSGTFVSTSDNAFKAIRIHLRRRFPTPSPYEANA